MQKSGIPDPKVDRSAPIKSSLLPEVFLGLSTRRVNQGNAFSETERKPVAPPSACKQEQ